MIFLWYVPDAPANTTDPKHGQFGRQIGARR
jgi:hypothetical protein